MTAHDWDAEVIPRCRHGAILLGCPDDECPEQNEYLTSQRAALDALHERQQAAARSAVRQALGMPEEVTP